MTSISNQVHAFLGEDLWLDMYQQLDENFAELNNKQYEYELRWQGQASITDTIAPILAREGIECRIDSSSQISQIAYGEDNGNIAEIMSRCSAQGDTIPATMVEKVQNSMRYIHSSYSQKASSKTQSIYDIAKIGIYTDGSTENSPFDLITDLEEIDKIIFTQELEYEGEEWESIDDAVQEFVDKNWNDPILELVTPEEGEEDQNSQDPNDENEVISPGDDDFYALPNHQYMCPVDPAIIGVMDPETGRVGSGSVNTPNVYRWVYPGWQVSNGASWGGPYPNTGDELSGNYSPIRDPWPCNPDEIFCIIIEMQTSEYGLVGGETMSIEKILARAGKHLEKLENTSLTQHKQTTNNFELGAIIQNLPDMLRWMRINVTSQPVPILDVASTQEERIEWGPEDAKNQLARVYKNQWLEYERRNDTQIFTADEHEQKIFEASSYMPITFPEQKLNEQKAFRNAQLKANDEFTRALDINIQSSALKEFEAQFRELQVFVKSLDDMTDQLDGTLKQIQKIPTRTP